MIKAKHGLGEVSAVFYAIKDSSYDFHIPIERVELTSQVFKKLNAKVTKRIYDNFGHSIRLDAIDFLNELF